MIKGKECLPEIKGISLRLTVLANGDVATSLNSLEISSQRKSQFRDKGAKVIYGQSRYNKLL
jgi:hypothetical protein